MSAKDEYEEEYVYPQCEQCYIKENSKWEPEGVGPDGSLISTLVAVAVPTRLDPGQINVCSTCGEITIAGIFVDLDEEDVKYDEGPLGSLEDYEDDE